MMSLRRRALISAFDYSLPDWFQETTYIANANSSSGTIPNLRLNLDYYPTNKTALYIQIVRLGNSDGFPFYAAKTQNGTTYYYGINLYNQYPYPRYGTIRGNYSVYTTLTSGVLTTMWFNDATVTNASEGRLLVQSATGNGVNDSARSSDTFRIEASLYLFANSSGSNPSRMQLYSNFKLHENGKLTVWLSTGYNKNNTSEVGVYDRVRRKFILPEGTGTMYKGADV